MSIATDRNRWLSLIAVGTVVAITITEIMTPLGYADWLLYVLPLFIAYLTENPKITFCVLGLAGIAMFLGFLFSPMPLAYIDIRRIATVNRFTGFAVLLFFTVVINKLILAKHRFVRLSSDLAYANRELESFSYSAAHDLRAPLRAIKGMGAIMMDAQGGRLDAEGRHCLQRIVKNTEKMDRLVESLIRLSQLSLQELQRDQVDISALVRGIVADLQQSEPGRKAVVRIGAHIVVRADRHLMEIALGNLLDNAWKYTARNETARIEFGATEIAGERTYYVKDNGVGFEEDLSDGLFEPFKRLHTEGEFPGSGIGLAIVDRILRRHGGRIWAVSAPGKGATFYFTLPG